MVSLFDEAPEAGENVRSREAQRHVGPVLAHERNHIRHGGDGKRAEPREETAPRGDAVGVLVGMASGDDSGGKGEGYSGAADMAALFRNAGKVRRRDNALRRQNGVAWKMVVCDDDTDAESKETL